MAASVLRCTLAINSSASHTGRALRTGVGAVAAAALLAATPVAAQEVDADSVGEQEATATAGDGLTGPNPNPSPGSAGDKPAWLWFEYGQRSFAEREYGEALQFYTLAIEEQSIYPEAQARIADIYALQGETELALIGYQQALAVAGAYRVADEQYATRYRVATLQRLTQDYRGLEKTLLNITAVEPEFSDARFTRLRQALVDVFIREGLDRTLQLYRLDTPLAVEAHVTLGWFFHRSGRDPRSIPHSLFAIINIVSEVARELRRRDTEYELVSIAQLMVDPGGFSPAGNRLVMQYMQDAELPRALYYLATAAHESGFNGRATELWRILAAMEAAGEYRDRARDQLISPSTEPRLEVPPEPETLPAASSLPS
jgi:tetratricopeptide (TPR) repeat protein